MVTLFIVVFFGFSWAVCDTLAHHFYYSIFRHSSALFWDPAFSWRSKYVNYDPPNGRRKFLKVFLVPVFLTDAWHLFKSFTLFLIFAAPYFYHSLSGNILFDLVIYRVAFGLSFTLFYSYVLIQKKLK